MNEESKSSGGGPKGAGEGPRSADREAGRGGEASRRAPRWDPVWRLQVRPLRVLLVLLLVFLVLALSMRSMMTVYAQWLIRTDPPVEADVAVVLGGGEGERLGAAVRIYRQGRVPALLITGPAKPLLQVYTGEDSLTQGEVKRRIAVRRGVPESMAWLCLGPTSTYEEAVTVRAEIERRGITSAIIVTSPLHSRRVSQTFRHVFGDRPVRLTVETLPPEMSQDQVREWWTWEHEMISVFSETVKLIHYWCRYGIPPI